MAARPCPSGTGRGRHCGVPGRAARYRSPRAPRLRDRPAVRACRPAPPQTRKVHLVARLFGTDGVRGLANGLLTAELALDLSVAAAHVLAEKGAFEGHRPVAVVGRDPRASGEFLSAAVIAGLASAGVDVLDAGILPTPAIAFLTADLGADLGVMLSASHNAMPDNGIKFFARGGHKLPTRSRTPSRRGSASRGSAPPAPASAGSAPCEDGPERYLRAPALGAAAPPRRPARGRRRRARCREQRRPRGLRAGRRPRQHDRLRARRPQHQRRLRLHPPGEPPARGRRSTAPTWASPSTGTPTAAWPWTPPARTWTATRS